MLDLGLTKMALIGVVALVVLGPERLPGVARTAGALFGRAQRYINDVKAEVTREIELDELKKMRTEFETAAIERREHDSRQPAPARNRTERRVEAGHVGVAEHCGRRDPNLTHVSATPGVAEQQHRHRRAKRKNWRVKQTRHAELVQAHDHAPHARAIGRGARGAAYACDACVVRRGFSDRITRTLPSMISNRGPA